MADPQRGDIFWVTIDSSNVKGSEQDKSRPYIVVSNDRINGSAPIVIGVPVSSSTRQNPYRIFVPQSEIVVDHGENGCAQGTALTHQVRVLSKDRLGPRR